MAWALANVLLALAAAALPCVPAAAQPVSQSIGEREARQQMQRMLVASPYRITEAALAGTLRYRFPSNTAAWHWPVTGEQRVRAGPEGVEITVCAECGDEPMPAEAELAALLKPNRWVDSDHPRVRAFARRRAGAGSVDQRMRRLERAVRAHMRGEVRHGFYATASEALRLRQGDCTEFALLLAAVARAEGIPARVAYGIAYASRFGGEAHVFTPHMWVQAWDGTRWRSYDAGLDGFRSGTLALMTGDGHTEDTATLKTFITGLRIESAAELRRRPAALQ